MVYESFVLIFNDSVKYILRQRGWIGDYFLIKQIRKKNIRRSPNILVVWDYRMSYISNHLMTSVKIEFKQPFHIETKF